MDSTVGLMLTDDLQELNLDRPITAQKVCFLVVISFIDVK